MTTISIPLPEQALRALEAQSKEAGKTPEQFAQEVLLRVAKLTGFDTFVARNETSLRNAGFTEADVMDAIESGIKEARKDRT